MRIGLIVPVLPPAPFLNEAVQSALEQERPPDEHAIVHDERGDGPAATRDRALAQLGACEWIALLDADDAWEPGKLAAQREAIAQHPDAVVCFGRATAVGGEGRPTGERLPELPAGRLSADELAGLLFDSNPIPTSSALVRRDALARAGGFAGPAPLASDWDLWLRLVAGAGAFVCEPRARVRYRRHAGGVTADVAALAESRLRCTRLTGRSWTRTAEGARSRATWCCSPAGESGSADIARRPMRSRAPMRSYRCGAGSAR
jgi:hypothetical protein